MIQSQIKLWIKKISIKFKQLKKIKSNEITWVRRHGRIRGGKASDREFLMKIKNDEIFILM